LPGEIDDVSLAAELLAGVKVQPISWHRQRPGSPGLVLGYAALGHEDIRAALRNIARRLQACRNPRSMNTGV
jgi:GntR family transcriptional regulator/MocR family aminotransferase